MSFYSIVSSYLSIIMIETCRDNDCEGYKEGDNASQVIADGRFGYKLFIKSSNITFSSFFSLRYSSFPFFSDDSSRGKRLRCSRAPLPPLRSSSWSALLPPSYGRAARAFFLRYSVRACGMEHLLVETTYVMNNKSFFVITKVIHGLV